MSVLDISTPSQAARALRMPVLIYSATIFLSAALFFCIEPMFSKMVLPVLGGSASVWSVAMVVFQGLLLAGYVYAHLLTRFLSLRTAAIVHLCVLTLAVASLPIAIASGFSVPPQNGVSVWLIGLFLASIGLPCFALSANAPLLQAWFARGGGAQAQKAYFLYRASNLGSFAVLLAYPFAIEPAFGLVQQSRLWSVGYLVLVCAIAGCAVVGLRAVQGPDVETRTRSAVGHRAKFIWAALGFIPSGLLVAVTAHITTDVASGPFRWIMPLALYLLTFVFAFTDRPAIPERFILALQPVTTGILIILLLWTNKIGWGLSLAGHLLAFFVAAMVCQIQLYKRRPDAAQLTDFYVWMSLGGVLGGAFAALAAPSIFTTVLEYPLLALAALFVRPDVWTAARSTWRDDGRFLLILAVAVLLPFLLLAQRTSYYVVCVMMLSIFLAFQGKHPLRLIGLAAALFLVTDLYDPSQSIQWRGRSFYGVYKAVTVDGGKFRVLFQGTTAHGGEQVRNDDGTPYTARPQPLTYYYKGGPYSQAIEAARRSAGGTLDRVALVGLGMGALSCAAAPRENWTFYEIDPLSVEIARNRALFRSVSLCAPNAPSVVGDGRLTLKAAKPGISLLILDTFSSDSVPVHMLTQEAFALYKSRLAPHGVIALNISNMHLALAPVVAASAIANGMVAAFKVDPHPQDMIKTLHARAQIAVIAQSPADLKAMGLDQDWKIVSPQQTPWTDDYSNILGAMLAKRSL